MKYKVWTGVRNVTKKTGINYLVLRKQLDDNYCQCSDTVLIINTEIYSNIMT